MSKIAELFTHATASVQDWQAVVNHQRCAYLGKKCVKNRKSEPEIAIGTCTVKYGKDLVDVIICPHRLLENSKIFLDCFHLLTLHEPGNELHIVPEVAIPGGSIDYFLVSARNGRVKDFVGIEIQALDTTGTVWPERQQFLSAQGLADSLTAAKPFGVNWKMTAKTTLVQLHHKIQTFENLHKRLVLVMQDCLLAYMRKEFTFAHISRHPQFGEAMHFHSYRLNPKDGGFSLSLAERRSTDAAGIAKCLGLQAEANIGLEVITRTLENKISLQTLLRI
jgi:hypothetical protein